MRTVPDAMYDRWAAGGPFYGDGRPVSRVTVEPDWYLYEDDAAPGASADKLPYRWFQREDNSQVETEVPYLTSVEFDLSISQDADTCTITIPNTAMNCNTNTVLVDRLGDPGHFSAYRSSTESRSRWGAQDSTWANILVENSLLRTYFGYGADAEAGTVADAVTAGDLLLTGTWLVDRVSFSPTSGSLQLSCRNMAKLLIDQKIYPPFAPEPYPLHYDRYSYESIVTDLTTAHVYNKRTPIQATESYPALGQYIIDVAYHPKGVGYWLLGTDGGVFSMATAFHGSAVPSMGSGFGAYAVSISPLPSGQGYYVLTNAGHVFAFGDAEDFGGLETAGLTNCLKIRSTPSGDGYWILTRTGRVYGFGDAPLKSQVLGTAIDLQVVPGGYDSETGAYHSSYEVLFQTTAIALMNSISDRFSDEEIIGFSLQGCGCNCFTEADSPTRLGYWAVTNYGRVISKAGTEATPVVIQPPVSHGGESSTYINAYLNKLNSTSDEWLPHQVFPPGNEHAESALRPTVRGVGPAIGDAITCVAQTPSGEGYVLVDGRGTVYSFPDATYVGSLTDATTTYVLRSDNNYLDYADIVKDIALWAGFYLKGTSPAAVHGTIESTGAYNPDSALPDEMFDKKSPIDPMTAIKEIVGYLLYVDHEGALFFVSPNWFEPGNMLEDGSHTDTIWALDEELNLTEWNPVSTDASLRSEIVIASEAPDVDYTVSKCAVVTKYTPPGAAKLRGMIKPASWSNGVFLNKREQQVMAEMVAMHAFFANHQGSASTPYFAGLQVNDQVWIYEKTTGTASIHYVRGIHMSHEIKSGKATMSLTTNKLGTPTAWAIE